MKIDIAQHASMSESGSSLLRLIQSQDIPLLDLLVRESIQNSLDAYDKKRKDKFVRVEISRRLYQAPKLNKHFEGIVDKLNQRFPDNKRYSSLVIGDKGTTGLTGPLSYDQITDGSDYGNLIKLVYEIGKNQTNEGAGGSWGLGKTVFFRFGIGLVIYYSRITDNKGHYESRLVACLVENEKKKSAMLPETGPLKRGIAWWGEERGLFGNKRSVPVTKEKEIREILDVFGLQPYADNETGTVVIIPYIDEELLLKEANSAVQDNSAVIPVWMNNISDYLNMAVQRWYAPRINNENYKGPYLNAWVDDKQILPTGMYPLFRIIREMYIMQSMGALPSNSWLEESGAEVHKDPIQVRMILDSGATAGWFMHARLTKEQLKMTPPDNLYSPYMMASNYEPEMDQGNVPMVMYTRRPAMIVAYDFSGPWTNRMPRTDDSGYIIGLFVANSDNVMKNMSDPDTGGKLTLEEYIRKTEKADHAVWADKSLNNINPKLIARIQTGVNNKAAKTYNEAPAPVVEKRNIGLGHALANLLLPAGGFGTASGGGGGGGGGGPRPKPTKKNPLTIEDGTVYAEDKVCVPFTLIPPEDGRCVLSLQVQTDYKQYSAENWEKKDEVGKKFPLHFKGILINEAKAPKKRGSWAQRNDVIKASASPVSTEDVDVCFTESSVYHTLGTLEIVFTSDRAVRGQLLIGTDDPSVRMRIDAKVEKL